MGDAGILFDKLTWKTHILTATAAIIYEALLEHGGGQQVPKDEAVRFLDDVLGLDPETPEIAQLLAMLGTLGLTH